MPHLGLICPPYSSHVATMAALGRELALRGNRVSVISAPDTEPAVRHAGLDFLPVGAVRHPVGSLARFTEEQGRLTGLAAVRFISRNLREHADVLLSELPALLTAQGIDALVIDQVSAAANTVADVRALPWVTVCSALAFHSEPDVPPWATTWGYRSSPLWRLRNTVGTRVMEQAVRPMISLVNEKRAAWGMPAQWKITEAVSPLAQLAQQPEFLDFPRRQLPDCFHYVGPLTDTDRPPVPFPWHRLDDDRPLIYASMGTLQNRRPEMFKTIARACEGLDAQLVISLGRADADSPPLPGDPVVVGYAPQLDLIARASLVISHGGVNTVMESLAAGVPVVAIPVANDQPGTASRLRYLGAGDFLTIRRAASPTRLRAMVQNILSDPGVRERAEWCRARLAELDGPGRAADLIEEAVRTRRPVLRDWLPAQAG